jgi:hypothetical protein
LQMAHEFIKQFGGSLYEPNPKDREEYRQAAGAGAKGLIKPHSCVNSRSESH